MIKYRVVQKDSDWAYLEKKTTWFPLWRFVKSGPIEHMKELLYIMISPPLMETPWKKEY